MLFWSAMFWSAMFWSAMFLSTSALRFLLCALGRCFVRPSVELVWLAEPTYTADRCLALLNSGETTICAAIPVDSAPFIRVGGS